MAPGWPKNRAAAEPTLSKRSHVSIVKVPNSGRVYQPGGRASGLDAQAPSCRPKNTPLPQTSPGIRRPCDRAKTDRAESGLPEHVASGSTQPIPVSPSRWAAAAARTTLPAGDRIPLWRPRAASRAAARRHRSPSRQPVGRWSPAGLQDAGRATAWPGKRLRPPPLPVTGKIWCQEALCF